jgi:hypothetical protein
MSYVGEEKEVQRPAFREHALRLVQQSDETLGVRRAHSPSGPIARWRAADVRSILAAGTGVPTPTPPGAPIVLTLPTFAVRPLSDYAIGREVGS